MPFILPTPLPVPPRKAKPGPSVPATPPPPSATSLKRAAPDDDGIEVLDGPAAKRARTTGSGTSDVLTSPSKKRRLEEDGLLLLETANERLDDEVIVVD